MLKLFTEAGLHREADAPLRPAEGRGVCAGFQGAAGSLSVVSRSCREKLLSERPCVENRDKLARSQWLRLWKDDMESPHHQHYYPDVYDGNTGDSARVSSNSQLSLQIRIVAIEDLLVSFIMYNRRQMKNKRQMPEQNQQRALFLTFQ